MLDSTAEFCRQVGGDESKASYHYDICVICAAIIGDRRHSVKEEEMVCILVTGRSVIKCFNVKYIGNLFYWDIWCSLEGSGLRTIVNS